MIQKTFFLFSIIIIIIILTIGCATITEEDFKQYKINQELTGDDLYKAFKSEFEKKCVLENDSGNCITEIGKVNSDGFWFYDVDLQWAYGRWFYKFNREPIYKATWLGEYIIWSLGPEEPPYYHHMEFNNKERFLRCYSLLKAIFETY